MSKNIQKKLELFMQLVKKTIDRNSKLILFGSYAKGRMKPWSDIDIAVIVPSIKDSFQKEVELRVNSLSIDERINPIIFTQRDMEENAPLLCEIKRFGKVL